MHSSVNRRRPAAMGRTRPTAPPRIVHPAWCAPGLCRARDGGPHMSTPAAFDGLAVRLVAVDVLWPKLELAIGGPAPSRVLVSLSTARKLRDQIGTLLGAPRTPPPGPSGAATDGLSLPATPPRP
jgi:hypothetical protein